MIIFGVGFEAYMHSRMNYREFMRNKKIISLFYFFEA